MKISRMDNRKEFLLPVKAPVMKIATTFVLGFTLTFLVPAMAAAESVASPAAANEIDIGRRIYLEGILPSGTELTGTRFGNTLVSGSSAACVNCHRRSGMGQVEGDVQVSPITGNFLFAAGKDKPLATMDPRVSKRLNQVHDPYTEASLENAIVHGINNHGMEMNATMPRFNLNNAEMKALTAYLKQLSSQWSPGVTGNNIHFAMVITPDVDPLRRKTLIDMMNLAVRQKNGSTEVAKPGAGGRHHMVSAAEFVLGTERNWTLDVWELQGAQETWGEQLATHYRNQPVFALISGLSNSTWQPVHDFCESEQVPCWFPSVDLPVVSQSQYSFYFSGGVRLEADVLARHLLDQTDSSPRHLVQIYHDDEAGRAASSELTHALAGSKISVENRILQTYPATADSLRNALTKIKHNDVAMFWLRPDDIPALDTIKPVTGKSYFSTVLAKAEHLKFSAAWKADVRLVYPYELPEKREVNLAYFHAWLNLRKLPLVDEAMQSEAFFALNFLTDTLSEMLDNIYRDYLLERAETMLSKREGSKAEQETRDRVALGRPGDLEKRHGAQTADESVRIAISSQQNSVGKSQGTTIYPHLSLGPGQRFASKGGYIVRFAGGEGDKLLAESGWIVP